MNVYKVSPHLIEIGMLFLTIPLQILRIDVVSVSKLRNSTECHNSQEDYRWSPVTAQRHCFGLGFSQIILK